MNQVQIGDEWRELLGVHERGEWRVYVYVDGHGDAWGIQVRKDSPLPTRPATEATFTPTPHEPVEGVKLYDCRSTSKQTGGIVLVTVDGRFAGWLTHDGETGNDTAGLDSYRHPVAINHYLQFAPALTRQANGRAS